MLNWEVLHYTLADGWVNTWTTYDEDGEESQTVFDSKEDAQAALDEFFAEIEEEIASGGRNPETRYGREEFIVCPVKTEKPIKPMSHPVGHKTGIIKGLTAGDIQAILDMNCVPDDDHVKFSWAFICDGRECGIWDYCGSSDDLIFSTYGPDNIFQEIFGNYYWSRDRVSRAA